MTVNADSMVLDYTLRDLLEGEVWARLLAIADRLELPAGAVLMRRGDNSAPVFVVEEGAFEVVDTRSSPETVLNVLGPGEILGEMSFIDGSPATAEVRARTHGVCHRWQRAELMAQLDAAPDLGLPFFRALAVTVVSRSRTVMSAALAGGFGAGAPSRERAENAEVDRVAESLAIELQDPLAGAGTEADPHLAIEVADALTSACRWFAAAADAARGAEVGARLRELLGELLGASTTTRLMLERPEGTPAGPNFFRHVLGGHAEGRDPAGALLDGAVLELPTFRGWRWRDRAMAGALAGALPASGARVLSVSLSGAPTSEPQLEVLRARSGHVTSIQLSQRTEGSVTPPGITRTALEADLPSLLRGAGPRVGAPHHVVILDRVCDVVPDEVLRALFTWARLQLVPTGQLIVGHAVPADDNALLDHLLRWPSLPRRSQTVVALLPRGGAHSTVAPMDDEAAGLIIWRPTP